MDATSDADRPADAVASAALLRAGSGSAVDLTEQALRRVRQPAGDSVMITVTADRARAEAAMSAGRYARGLPAGPLDGIPIAWKDLFDVADTVTTAGSRWLSGRPPARADAALVRRAREAGLVTVGKTTLSELAFSGLGINESFGTPRNPAGGGAVLVPGGSSSGSAVAVAAGIVPLAVGTDTSGSVRVPAAFCGVVGYRATPGRYFAVGTVPLSVTLDSIGVFAHSVRDVVALDCVLARAHRRTAGSGRPRLIIPAGELIDDCTPGVRHGFERAVAQLRRAGFELETRPLPVLQESQRLLDEVGTLVGAEAYALYGELIDDDRIDRSTRRRLAANAEVGGRILALSGPLPALREAWRSELDGGFLLCPTVRLEPPCLEPLLSDERLFDRTNERVLRTTMLLSYLGSCGVSLPLATEDGSPIGLSISVPGGADESLLGAAADVEAALTTNRSLEPTAPRRG